MLRKALLVLCVVLLLALPVMAHGPRSQVTVVFGSAPVYAPPSVVTVTRTQTFYGVYQPSTFGVYGGVYGALTPTARYGVPSYAPMPTSFFIDAYGNTVIVDQFGRIISIR